MCKMTPLKKGVTVCECVREPLLLSLYFTEEYVSLWCLSVALTCVS